MFVKRDNNNQIVAVSMQAAEGFNAEKIHPHDPELVKFMYAGIPEAPATIFRESDADLVRVLEDLIDLLTGKGVIQFTDLPTAAQHKLLARQSIRKRLNGLDLLAADPDNETISL